MSEIPKAPDQSVLMIGGRDAGKSNYLFRLWLAIQQETGLLRKSRLPDDLAYLRHGSDQLLEGRYVERTVGDLTMSSEIPVMSTDGVVQGTLTMPDIHGEEVIKIYLKREWSELWENSISKSSACLLFVRAASDEVVHPLDWITASSQFGSIPSTQPSPRDDAPPTQVLLTEWLQFLRRAFQEKAGPDFRPRIGLVVSAWDAVPADQREGFPEEYIAENFPMVDQFIASNEDAFEFKVFGLSATGGDLKNDQTFRDAYLAGDPQSFGFVVHTTGDRVERVTDVTYPVAWALGVSTAGTRE